MNKRVKRYSSQNILRERIETCRDFTLNLLSYIDETYFGDNYLRTEKDIVGHFNWCYSKVLNDFYEEGLDFHNNDELYDHYYKYFLSQYYLGNNRPIEFYIKFWNNIFDYQKNLENEKKFKLLSGLYEIFEKSYLNKLQVSEVNKILNNSDEEEFLEKTT